MPAIVPIYLAIERDLNTEVVRVRPGCFVVAVRESEDMFHLQRLLEKTNLRRHDVVVMTVCPIWRGASDFEIADNRLFSKEEVELFTRALATAEILGKEIALLAVAGSDPFETIVETTAKLQASRLVTGVSSRMASEELARRIGLAWERLSEPRHSFSLEIISRDRASTFVNLGPHPPRLWPEDIDRLHELWLQLTAEMGSLHRRRLP